MAEPRATRTAWSRSRRRRGSCGRTEPPEIARRPVPPVRSIPVLEHRPRRDATPPPVARSLENHRRPRSTSANRGFRRRCPLLHRELDARRAVPARRRADKRRNQIAQIRLNAADDRPVSRGDQDGRGPLVGSMRDRLGRRRKTNRPVDAGRSPGRGPRADARAARPISASRGRSASAWRARSPARRRRRPE